MPNREVQQPTTESDYQQVSHLAYIFHLSVFTCFDCYNLIVQKYPKRKYCFCTQCMEQEHIPQEQLNTTYEASASNLLSMSKDDWESLEKNLTSTNML